MAVTLDQAFAGKGKFTFSKPLTYVKENFIHTKWKRDYAWRPFLDPLIVSLGDQQLVTGYAVLLSGWIKIGQHSLAIQGAHFALILYVSSLSSSSHLAALISLRRYLGKYKFIARVRMSLVVGFALFLLSSMVATIAVSASQNANHSLDAAIVLRKKIRALSYIVPMLFITLGFSVALVCILFPRPGAGLSPVPITWRCHCRPLTQLQPP